MSIRFKNVDVWKLAVRSAGVTSNQHFHAIFREKNRKYETFRKDFAKLQEGLVNGEMIRSQNLKAADSSFQVFIMQVLGTGKMGLNYPVNISTPTSNKPLLKAVKRNQAPREFYDFVEKYSAQSGGMCADLDFSEEDEIVQPPRAKRKRRVQQHQQQSTITRHRKFQKTQRIIWKDTVADDTASVICSGENKFHFTDRVQIGTAKWCDIRFESDSDFVDSCGQRFSDSIAHVHVCISHHLFHSFKIDRPCTAKVFINDSEMESLSHVLQSGDRIRIDQFEFQFF